MHGKQQQQQLLYQQYGGGNSCSPASDEGRERERSVEHVTACCAAQIESDNQHVELSSKACSSGSLPVPCANTVEERSPESTPVPRDFARKRRERLSATQQARVRMIRRYIQRAREAKYNRPKRNLFDGALNGPAQRVHSRYAPSCVAGYPDTSGRPLATFRRET